jgi:ubiquinol-cytochrome c reductase cytochrome c subunit
MRIAVFLAAALCAAAASAQDAPKGSAERGRKLFVDLNCYSCHGTHGQGGGRNSEPTIPAGYPWQGFLNQLRKPRLDMPPYEAKLVSDQEVADMFAYFAALKPAPAAKDIPLLR